jgi:phage anti-repressor protein
MKFSHELALSLIQSTELFPVNFEEGWRWIGYSTKQKAKIKLLNNFESGIDYLTEWVKNSCAGRPSESFQLTIDCFKSLAMMAGTERGKEVRKYFLKCERIAKQAVETIPAQAQELERLKLELELLRAKQRYQDSAQAVLASSSPAMLAYLRGDSLPPVRIEYRDRFIDSTTGKTVESQDGRSLTKLIADAGLNPKSSRDRQRVKNDPTRAWIGLRQRVRLDYYSLFTLLQGAT